MDGHQQGGEAEARTRTVVLDLGDSEVIVLKEGDIVREGWENKDEPRCMGHGQVVENWTLKGALLITQRSNRTGSKKKSRDECLWDEGDKS